MAQHLRGRHVVVATHTLEFLLAARVEQDGQAGGLELDGHGHLEWSSNSNRNLMTHHCARPLQPSRGRRRRAIGRARPLAARCALISCRIICDAVMSWEAQSFSKACFSSGSSRKVKRAGGLGMALSVRVITL